MFNFTSRKFLVTTFLTLILLLGVLVYFFIKLNSPAKIKIGKTKGYKYLFSIYGYGKEKSELFNRPNGIAISKEGKIYVTDQGNNRILVFDSNANFLFKFGEEGSKTGQFKAPMGIAVSPDNQVYVTDRIQNKILIFDKKGKFIKEFRVKTPLTPAIYNNHLYVTTNTKLLMFDLNGKIITDWGKGGINKSEFNFPNGIAIGKNKIIYVADSNNVRIQALKLSGEAVWVTGDSAQGLESKKRAFGLPVSIALDEKNYLYVVDAFPGTIHVLNDRGKEIKQIGKSGKGDGQFNLPAQIAYAGNRIFYIVDKYNNRVQAIQIPPPVK